MAKVAAFLFFGVGPVFGIIAAIAQMKAESSFWMFLGYLMTVVVAVIVAGIYLIFIGTEVLYLLSFRERARQRAVKPKVIPLSTPPVWTIGVEHKSGQACPHGDGGVLQLQCFGGCSRYVACTANRDQHFRPMDPAERLEFMDFTVKKVVIKQ